MEELGYEQEGVIRRAPDSPLDLPTAAPPLVGAWRDRAPRRMREVAQPDAIAGYTPPPRQRIAEGIARSMTGRVNIPRDSLDVGVQTVLGGEKSALPLGLGLLDATLVGGMPLYAMDAGERAGRDVAQGDYGSAAMETALALGVPLAAARMMNRGAGVEDAIDRARRMNVGPRRGQMGAIAEEPPPPLSNVLGGMSTTLRTLENLPQRQSVIGLDTIRQQLRRSEITKPEREVMEKILSTHQGDTISAQELARRVQDETKQFALFPKDTDQFATYGLENIGRDDRPWVGRVADVENARTTIHRSPTPTSTDNHFKDPNYFGHTRAFDADGITHVVELQSDLAQKAGKTLSAEDRAYLEDRLAEARQQLDFIRNQNAMVDRGELPASVRRTVLQPTQLRIAELESKLSTGVTAEAQRPMFKNWERRLIREEISRAARAYEDLPNKIAYFEGEIAKAPGLGIDDTHPAIRDLQRRLDQARQQMTRPPVIRFADADAVARVEGWPKKLDITPGDEFDATLRGKRLSGSLAGTVNDWKYTGHVRVDEGGMWEAERIPIDVNGNAIGNPVWSNRGSTNISQSVVDKRVKESDKLQFPEHQGIYDRYSDEVTKYLKSLGAKRITDKNGYGWWEVPVDPKKYKRTQIFSMTGAAVAGAGAAGYNAPVEE